MTRLVESDVRCLTADLEAVERDLVKLTGLGLVGIAARACGVGEDRARAALARTHAAAVPITSGLGVISGFTECMRAILSFIGCEAHVTGAANVSGFHEALSGGDTLAFAADDDRFLAFNLSSGGWAENDRGTAEAYVAALDAGAGGVAGKPVLVMGYGRVGPLAAARLAGLGATVLVAEPDGARRAAAGAAGFETVAVTADGLARCRLVFDATPVPDIVPASWVTPDSVVAAPGMPCGVTAEAAMLLGERLVHEPLALGVAAMAVRALLGAVD
jgi:pyrrolysine biosynthesis protein PylD